MSSVGFSGSQRQGPAVAGEGLLEAVAGPQLLALAQPGLGLALHLGQRTAGAAGEVAHQVLVLELLRD